MDGIFSLLQALMLQHICLPEWAMCVPSALYNNNGVCAARLFRVALPCFELKMLRRCRPGPGPLLRPLVLAVLFVALVFVLRWYVVTPSDYTLLRNLSLTIISSRQSCSL